MTAPSDLPSLYSQRPVNLWVEDDETKAYLDGVWQDAEIGYLVAGGSENVGVVVKSARAAGIQAVFGVRDRDFQGSNRKSWRTLTNDVTVFTLECLELENLALDANAISGTIANTEGLTAEQIDRLLANAARRMVWYMSCRYTIAVIRDAIARDFTRHPKPDGTKAVGSFAAARDWILGSAWWQEVLPAATAHLTAANVELALHFHQHWCAEMAESQDWKQRFSGKEILDATINTIWRRGRPSSARRDLLIMVAEQQRLSGTIPPEVKELHEALRARAGMAPKPL